MLRGMTAFARIKKGDLVGELRSVNRRHLDVHVHLPSHLARFEIPLARQISQAVGRGHVTFSIETEYEGELPLTIAPNLPLWRSLHQAGERLAHELNLDGEECFELAVGSVDPAELFTQKLRHEEVQESLLMDLLVQTLKPFMRMKESEGEVIEADLLERVGVVRKQIDQIEKRFPKVLEKLKEREEMPEKGDITEEIIRFSHHLNQIEERLAMKESTSGKVIDFILQELHREINTIGAKGGDVKIGDGVVAIKLELERIREQVQNVE